MLIMWAGFRSPVTADSFSSLIMFFSKQSKKKNYIKTRTSVGFVSFSVMPTPVQVSFVNDECLLESVSKWPGIAQRWAVSCRVALLTEAMIGTINEAHWITAG